MLVHSCYVLCFVVKQNKFNSIQFKLFSCVWMTGPINSIKTKTFIAENCTQNLVSRLGMHKGYEWQKNKLMNCSSNGVRWSNEVRHCGRVVSAPAWDGTGCEFDSWQCRIYIPCSLSLRLLASLRGSLGFTKIVFENAYARFRRRGVLMCRQ